MRRHLPIAVLWVAAVLLFVLGRAYPPLSEKLFLLSPMKALLGVFGPEETFGAAQRMFGPRAALGLGTAMLLVGGYFIPYLLAGFLAWTRLIFNAVIGSMGPLVMFAGPTHALLDSTIAFAFASPFLAAFYCVGILGRRQIVMRKKMPNTPLERTHDD